ncbi:Vitelline membrane outer layer protein 1 [Orchesella cincta]|uniref:Vitelline membrane outer layer protein 1 n=1 Tax=Orchesella cincta TaxID=48709 RepID=A0A1D2M797_ORCCI|nr:Vitelline membrane outer layer protein 1 [Orchesella cincta]
MATTIANINITSPAVTNWGEWGIFERCPEGRYAQGFQLRTQQSQFKGDDSSLTTIKLFCGDPSQSDTSAITSTEGQFGDWGKIFSCFPGYLNGFQLRSEKNRGTGDDTAANNIRFYCTSLPDRKAFIEGDGLFWGEWTQPQHCEKNQAICAIQSQVDSYKVDGGDNTALNNVRMECCGYD